MIEDVAYPVFLDGADFAWGHVGQHFIQYADQYGVVARYRHRQLVAIGRFAADVEAFKLELAKAPDT
ncbi:hypothetical protein D3C73_1643310 [compost metagenome]